MHVYIIFLREVDGIRRDHFMVGSVINIAKYFLRDASIPHQPTPVRLLLCRQHNMGVRHLQPTMAAKRTYLSHGVSTRDKSQHMCEDVVANAFIALFGNTELHVVDNFD
jgi:hypothetical protein